jgi:putative ABC transport system permease protein
MASESSVSPDYFRAMGIPFLRGRSFDGRDVAGGAPTVIVSESVARKFFAGEDPLGKSLGVFGQPRTIVGVVGNVKQASLETDAALQVYRSFAQVPDNDLLFVVRAREPGHDAALLGAIRKAITRGDRNLPVYAAQPLAALVGESIARQKFSMTVFAVFSGAALLLAALGIYGVMAYSVSQRRGEIGIRMALGAQAHSIARLVLSEGGRVVAFGVASGLVGSLLLTGLLDRLLFGTPAHDPTTFAVVALLVALVATPACLVPALRAARVDPMTALRGP